MNSVARTTPRDLMQREYALDPARSILVKAPAGSGKTTLLTERFLTLLSQVDEPGQIVAITFTNAAAAEMRIRILDELRKNDPGELARRALERSKALGWKLLELPAQLRIMTIDSFCRELALQQPLLSGLGGGLGIYEQPKELYRRAARRTLERIDTLRNSELSEAIEELLLWRDNNWREMEELLVTMLAQRDRWMHGFVLERKQDWDALRERLELPFAKAIHKAFEQLKGLFDQASGALDKALRLARFACECTDGEMHQGLAELAEFPAAPFADSAALDEAHQAYLNLTQLLLTKEGGFRKTVNKLHGFPADRKKEKNQFAELIATLRNVPGLEEALMAVRDFPSVRYTENDWYIVRSCFQLLSQAAGELKVVFAEVGAVDFIEVAQIAQKALTGPDGLPSDNMLAVADGIRHLLVDEFQDTSRRQHQLLAGLIAGWPERSGRTCFVVGDPMQSIYFFRDADAELFSRVEGTGLEVSQDEPLHMDSVALTANFRTAPALVEQLNQIFADVFAENDGSGVRFSAADPAREISGQSTPRLSLHLEFIPNQNQSRAGGQEIADLKKEIVEIRQQAKEKQIDEIVALIRSRLPRIEQARLRGEKFRVAVLGRTRSALAQVAEALRKESIAFRAVDLEELAARPEVLDALSLGRALLNPEDRVAWLGVLRAPWCGLALDELHRLVSGDDVAMMRRVVPTLLVERLSLVNAESRNAVERVLEAFRTASTLRSVQPATSLGTQLKQLWLQVGGADCVDATACANLDLLWSCLDRLPEGEQDLTGSALDAALNDLTALPDPSVSSDCGVQLMTIHKSKGLEFESVIVPELQASGRRTEHRLLSWLERGLAVPDESGEITEFLVAPLKSKSGESGKTKEWVDKERRRREQQEMRRLLYVAATRAREELHLFARLEYNAEEQRLSEPSNSLLATAWPALGNQIQERFDEWSAEVFTGSGVVEAIAAEAKSNLLVMPAFHTATPSEPTKLWRLPANYVAAKHSARGTALAASSVGTDELYDRHEGSLLSRVLGRGVHALLEKIALWRVTSDWVQVREKLKQFKPQIAAEARAAGVTADKAVAIADEALQIALKASEDSCGQWLLSPHTAAASEAGWAGVIDGKLRSVRVDRVFQAGSEPLTEGDAAWWIVDYKTTDAAGELPELRKIFAKQLEAYAQILRNMHSNARIFAGLYYPRMLQFDWWQI